MKRLVFSPLAVMCSLCVLYPPADPIANQDIASLEEEFVTEELPFEFLSEDWSTDTESAAFSTEEISSRSASTESETQAETLLLTESEEDFSTLSSVEAEEETLLSDEIPSPADTHTAYPLRSPSLVVDNQDLTSSPLPPPHPDNTSFLSIGANYTYVHFKPHGNMSFTGSLGGMQGLYEYRPCNALYGALAARWRQGETKAHHASRFLIDISAEERLGYTFAIDHDKWLWTLFTGFGYRHLSHKLKQPGQETMRFNYNEFYVPVAVFTDDQVSSWFSWGVHATWMPQVFPTVSIVPLKGAYWKTLCKVGNVLLEMPFSFYAGKNQQFFLTLSPSFQYWQDGRTTAKDSLGQHLRIPQNTYFFWGADLNFGYAF